MKREFEFAGNFAMTVLLLAGSFAVAQRAATEKAQKAGPAAVAGNSGQGAPTPQPTRAAAVAGSQATDAAVSPATTQIQPSETTTKPKTIVSADKRTITVPQL